MIEAIKRFIGMIIGAFLIVFFLAAAGGVFEIRHPDHHDVDAINIHFVPSEIPGFVSEVYEVFIVETYEGWRDTIINFSVGESRTDETNRLRHDYQD